MSGFRASSVRQPPDPDRLWMWERSVFKDENQRTWLPAPFQVEDRFYVLMRQEDIPLGEPLSPSQLGKSGLPVMWQLYPGRSYRGTDSMNWHVVYHIEFRGVEDLLLQRMPDED